MKEKGFSLLEVMIAAALLGAVAMGGMKVMENISVTKKSADAMADEIELRNAVRLILDSEKNCRVSLAGNGNYGAPMNPVNFKKKDHDEADEGLSVSLWLSNQAGNQRSTLKFQPGTKFENLTIKNIRLVMNNGTNSDYQENPEHQDVGQIFVDFEKGVGSKNRTRPLLMKFDVDVTMETSATGTSTILSCSSKKPPTLAPMYSRCMPESSPTTNGSDHVWHSSFCKSDRFITKLIIYAADRLDGPLQQICCNIKNRGADGTAIVLTSPTTGGSDDQDHKINCPQDLFMDGYEIYASNKLDGPVKIRCQAIKDVYAGACYDYPGTSQGMDSMMHTVECPYGTAMAGVNFYASDRLDSIKSVRCCEIKTLE